MTALYLEALERAAEEARTRETTYRREAARTIAALDAERAFAFRKLNLMRALAGAMIGAEEEQAGVGRARALLCGRLGWSEESEPRRAALDRFSNVARSVFACQMSSGETAAEIVIAELAAFETWYQERHGVPFWMLFEQEMPETPLVDF